MLDLLLQNASKMTLEQVATGVAAQKNNKGGNFYASDDSLFDLSDEDEHGNAYEWRVFVNGKHPVSGVDIVSFEAIGHP